MAVFTTPLQFLRNLLDDENAASYYWSDDELNSYLDHERRQVVPFAEGERFSDFFSILPSGYDYYRPRASAAAEMVPSADFLRWQARQPYRFWADDPAAVIYVNGTKAQDAGYTWTTDALNGAITFTAGAALTEADAVSFAADYYNIYEAAHTCLLVAMGQWAAVQEQQTPTGRTRRASIQDALLRVEALRRKGRPRPKSRYRKVS